MLYDKPFLILPGKEYQESFENYVRAYRQINDSCYLDLYKKGLESFDEYLTDLRNYSQGIDLPAGYVTASTFWLVDGHEVVGVVRIRPQGDEFSGHIGYDISPRYRNKGYGSAILKLALEKAAEFGISEAIVTCNTENLASKRIIEKCSGILLGVVFDEAENEHLYKYKISTATGTF